MSTRTLIEINHDQLKSLLDRPDIVDAILRNLGMTTYNASLNEANAEGRALEITHGVRIVLQRHHSTAVKVTTEYQTVKI